MRSAASITAFKTAFQSTGSTSSSGLSWSTSAANSGLRNHAETVLAETPTSRATEAFGRPAAKGSSASA